MSSTSNQVTVFAVMSRDYRECPKAIEPTAEEANAAANHTIPRYDDVTTEEMTLTFTGDQFAVLWGRRDESQGDDLFALPVVTKFRNRVSSELEDLTILATRAEACREVAKENAKSLAQGGDEWTVAIERGQMLDLPKLTCCEVGPALGYCQEQTIYPVRIIEPTDQERADALAALNAVKGGAA